MTRAVITGKNHWLKPGVVSTAQPCTVMSSSGPFHIAPTFDLDIVEHLLHLYDSIIQFFNGSKATTYSSLKKNIIEMKIFSRYIYYVSTPFILVFIMIFNIFIFNHFDPKYR